MSYTKRSLTLRSPRKKTDQERRPISRQRRSLLTYLQTKDTNFPDACLALLRKVLIEAGLGAEEDIKKSKIIDLGIGCGEQSLILARECYQYIGITIDKDQLNFALSRREWENLEAEYPSSSATKSTKDDRKAQLYLADAAKPVCWSRQLRDATSTKNGQENEENACWVLALDCLYHFSPSRKPVLHFANHNANASIMAFDLILSPSSTVLQRFLLRILTLIMGVPSSNFITKTQYEDQLIKAGYSKDRISISDISDGVFSGLAGFIEKRDEDWRTFTGQGIGPYRMFARILRWWEKSGVVRGVIVVAKR